MTAYNDEVLFIHIPKTGGHSVRKWLTERLPDVITHETVGTKLPMGHLRLADVERFLGRKPESFKRIIAVVRDPYEQQLSQWLYLQNRYARNFHHIHDVVAAQYPTLTQFLQDPLCDYHVAFEQHNGYGSTHTNTPRQTGDTYQNHGGFIPYWVGIDGELPDNVELIQLEHLEERLPCAVCDVQWTKLDKDPVVPRLNATPLRGSVRDYYTLPGAKIVEDKFSWTFSQGLYETSSLWPCRLGPTGCEVAHAQ